MLRAVALMLVIVTGPSVWFCAVRLTCWKSRLATWVRNGKPSMLTPGRCCSPCCWILLAMTLSATAFTAKSSTTSSTMITTRVMIQPRPRPGATSDCASRASASRSSRIPHLPDRTVPGDMPGPLSRRLRAAVRRGPAATLGHGRPPTSMASSWWAFCTVTRATLPPGSTANWRGTAPTGM